MLATIACPETLIPDARHLMMVLGEGPADAASLAHAGWTRGDTLYAVASGDMPLDLLSPQPLRPAWDTDQAIDMAAALRASDLMVIRKSPEGLPLAAPGTITVIVDMDGLAAVHAMGLERAAEQP